MNVEEPKMTREEAWAPYGGDPMAKSAGRAPVTAAQDSPEETFRRVLAARLPAGPGWTAWIDGTVAELAAAEDLRVARAEERLAKIAAQAEHVADTKYPYVTVDWLRTVLTTAERLS